MSIFSDDKADDLLVISLDKGECCLHHFCLKSALPSQLNATRIEYDQLNTLFNSLNSWCEQNHLKHKSCRWLLSRDLYKTYALDEPKIAQKEIRKHLQWQVKDLLDFSLEEALISYYKPHQESAVTQQIIAVAVEKILIESIITFSRDAGLDLKSIEIEELAIGHALRSHLAENQIIGYVGEDKSGLTFNFYVGDELAFTRRKKEQYIPPIFTDGEEFKLESETSEVEDIFILETQRTLDYVVSQLFRKPIDCLLLQQSLQSTLTFNQESQQQEKKSLADTVQELIEVPVKLIAPQINMQPINMQAAQSTTQQNESSVFPGLAEVGLAIGGAV